MMRYKGYVPEVWFEPDDRAFHGHVIGTRDIIHFTATDVEGLEREFRESVDVYLEFCAEKGIEPDKPFSGRLAFRTTPEAHRKMTEAARARGVSVNQWMDEVLNSAADQELAE